MVGCSLGGIVQLRCMVVSMFSAQIFYCSHPSCTGQADCFTSERTICLKCREKQKAARESLGRLAKTTDMEVSFGQPTNPTITIPLHHMPENLTIKHNGEMVFGKKEHQGSPTCSDIVEDLEQLLGFWEEVVQPNHIAMLHQIEMDSALLGVRSRESVRKAADSGGQFAAMIKAMTKRYKDKGDSLAKRGMIVGLRERLKDLLGKWERALEAHRNDPDANKPFSQKLSIITIYHACCYGLREELEK